MKVNIVFEFNSAEEAQAFLATMREHQPSPSNGVFNGSPSEASSSEVTYLDAARLLTQLVKDRGRPVAVEVLQRLGVQRLSDLPAERLSEFVEAAQAALQKEE